MRMIKRDTVERLASSPSPELQRLADSHYVHIFCRDVRQKILPFRVGLSEHKGVDLSLVPDQSLSVLFHVFSSPDPYSDSSRRSSRNGVADSLTEFIRYVAGHLAFSGKSNWEIASEVSGDQENLSASILVEVPGKVELKRAVLRQHIPKADRDRVGAPHIDLPISKAWIAKLPERLGDESKQYTRLKTLERASPIAPKFYDEISPPSQSFKDYVATGYSDQKHKTVAKALSDWGWFSTYWESETVTEFYHKVRTLQFHKTLAELRVSIVDDMNTLLGRLDIQGEIRLVGLQSPGDIQESINQFNNGEIGVSGAREIIFAQYD